MGLEALTPRDRGELVFLYHTPCVTLSGEQPARLRSKCCVEEALSLDGLGLSSCARALVGIVGRAGTKDQAHVPCRSGA
jgi:hypothetical protein